MRAASLVVLAPSGQKTRVNVDTVPFTIGRQSDNHLVLRDNRASRKHARILYEGGTFAIEDLESRHGIWVNGQRVRHHVLRESDRIELGLQDSYQLIFTYQKDGFRQALNQFSAFVRPEENEGELTKLRSLVEVARALENSLSTEEVLSAVVDAALTVTGCARGFLLLRSAGSSQKNPGLEISVARDRSGRNLAGEDLKVPTGLLFNRLSSRRELLSMSMTGAAEEANVVCLPLVRVGSAAAEETRATTTAEETVGMIYMDSGEAADLSSGNRELLETLAIEASTILENARLLEEERAKIRLDDELRIAREIQRGLQPVSLPSTGWFRAAGSSRASTEVGGDYFDVHAISNDVWMAVLADVSGKGVSSALLAGLLQGMFLMATGDPSDIEPSMARLNEFLLERTKGEKYATVFFCILESSGRLSYTNAGQCAPLLVKRNGTLTELETTSVPVGMLEGAPFQMVQIQLTPGDKLVIYSDGVTEAAGAGGAFYGTERLLKCVRENTSANATNLHAALMTSVDEFVATHPSGDEGLRDDVTALVIEYAKPA